MVTYAYSMREFILSERKPDTIELITGLPGSGKSFLTHHLSPPPFELDSIGETKGNDWIVDPTKLPTSQLFISGTSTNIGDVIKYLKQQNSAVKRVSLDWIIPDLSTFRLIQGRKVIDGIKMKLPSVWINTWKTRSQMTDDQIETVAKTELQRLINSIHPDELRFIVMDKARKPIKKGWH